MNRRKTGKAEQKPRKLSSTAGTGDILCPFFQAHNETNIRCMDIYPGTSSIQAQFENRREKNFHMDTYCKGNFKKCWLYDTAMRMIWDEKED